MNFWFRCIAFVCVIVQAHAAVAAKVPPGAFARAQYKRGETAFKLGRFTEALEAFSSAYETKPTPPLLFNIAQCHYNLHNWERAVFFYEGFLRDSPSHPAREQAIGRLADARQFAKAEAAAAEQPALVPREIVASAPASTPLVTPTAAPREEGPPPVYQRWWFWTVIGVVVAGGAATAVVFLTPPKLVAPAGSVGTVDWR